MEQTSLEGGRGARVWMGPYFRPRTSLIEELRLAVSVSRVAEANRASRFTRNTDLDAFLQGHFKA